MSLLVTFLVNLTNWCHQSTVVTRDSPIFSWDDQPCEVSQLSLMAVDSMEATAARRGWDSDR